MTIYGKLNQSSGNNSEKKAVGTPFDSDSFDCGSSISTEPESNQDVILENSFEDTPESHPEPTKS